MTDPTPNAGGVTQLTASVGGLMLASTVPSGWGPEQIAVSPNGESAYVANYNDDTVSQYSLGSGGALSPDAPASVAAGSEPYAIAVSPDSTSVYVTDHAAAALSEYTVNAGGTLSLDATVATGPDPSGVAVSPDGASVYVTDYGSGCVSEYSREAGGELVPDTPSTVATGPEPSAIAVSPNGNVVYVTDFRGGADTVSEFAVEPTGTLSPLVPATVATGNEPRSIAVSPNDGAAYVTAGADVYQYTIGSGGALSPDSPASVATSGVVLAGIAVSGGGGAAYALSESGVVAQFTIGASGALSPASPASATTGYEYGDGLAVSPDAAPTVSAQDSSTPTGGASGSMSWGAKLTGSVNPDGLPTAYVFEYGTTTSFGAISAPASSGSGDALVPVSAALSGLAANTTYFLRLVATNAAGTATGAVSSFSTGPGGTPIVTTGPPVGVGNTTATLGGDVDPEGLATAFTIEYGTSTSFGAIAPVVELDNACAVEPVTSTLTRLEPGTTYDYRFVATNALGTSAGSVASFTAS